MREPCVQQVRSGRHRRTLRRIGLTGSACTPCYPDLDTSRSGPWEPLVASAAEHASEERYR